MNDNLSSFAGPFIAENANNKIVKNEPSQHCWNKEFETPDTFLLVPDPARHRCVISRPPLHSQGGFHCVRRKNFFSCASKDAGQLAEEDNSKEFWSKHSLFVENTREELVAICTSKKLLETQVIAKATEGESSWTGSCNIYDGNLSEVPSSVAQFYKQPVRFLRAVLRFHGCCPLGTKDELVRFFALLLLSFFSSTR